MTITLDRPPAPDVASNQLVIDVLPQDIASALPGPAGCPIAQALRRLGYANAFVGIRTATIGRREYRLDASGRDLTRAFDNGRRVKPMRVTLLPHGNIATDTLDIVVTLDDVRRGVPNNHYTCALGLALHRAGYPRAWIGYKEVRVNGKNDCELVFAQTPESEAWVRAFDASEPVAPERFVLHRKQHWDSESA